MQGCLYSLPLGFWIPEKYFVCEELLLHIQNISIRFSTVPSIDHHNARLWHCNITALLTKYQQQQRLYEQHKS